MMNPLDRLPGERKLWLGLLALAVLIAWGTRQAYLRYRSASYVNVMLGCQPVKGVAESGFHFQEETDSRPFRWTNGGAKLLVPVNTRRPPRRLWVSIEALRPDTTPVKLQVLVDGAAIFDEPVPAGEWEATFDLDSHQFSDATLVELRSSTFVPKGVMDAGKNTDTRVLGVQVKGIMLRRE
jgi:hypothetical protein